MSKYTSRLAFVTCASLALVGCGKSDAPTASSNSGGAAVADPGKPASANDLVGMWFRVDDAAAAAKADDVIGVEFTPDNKLTLVGRPAGRQAGDEMTLDATRLDNGRVRLAAPGNASVTQTVQCNLNGDTLTITPESAADFAGGTFTRLPAGKTVVARYAERIKERQAEAAALGEKLNAFLAQPNLAILPADGNPGSLRVAITTADAGTTGLMTVANVTMQRQVQLSRSPNSVPPTLTVTLGPVVGPPGAKPMQTESFQFVATSAPDGTIALRDNQAHVLKPDADATKSLADAYAAGVAKQREILDAFHATLGALVLAEGETRPGQPTPRAALLRVPDKDAYLLAAYRGTEASLLSTSFTVPHVVMLQDGAPLLVNPQTNQILSITGDGDARAFEGVINGTPSKLKITRAMTLDDLKARQTQIHAFVDSLKTTPLSLVGQFYQSYTYDGGYVRPVRLDLTSADGKTITGTYHADAMNLDVPIAGELAPTLLGVQLKFALAKPTPPVADRFDEGGSYTADVALVDGRPIVVGHAQPGDGANRLDLAPPDDARAAALRAKLDAVLANGGAFKWARTGNTGAGTEVMTLALAAPDADGHLTGAAGFRKSLAAPVAGTIQTANGSTVLTLTIAATPKATVGGTMRLWLVPYGDAFYLSGNGQWTTDKSPRVVCYGPTTP